MASLTGTKIKDTYDSLLKVSDNGALDGTLQTITDGLGNNSALSLSTAGASVGGTLAVSGNAAFDTNTLFVDAANNVVGIGTTPSGAKLDVLGNLRVRRAAASTQYAEIESGGGQSFIRAINGAAASYQALIFESGNNTTTTERMRIDSSGFVGIGEQNPLVPLHISRNTASGENLALILDNNDTTANAEVGLLFRAATGGQNTDFQISTINTAANQAQLVFRSDGGTERARFYNGGDISFRDSSANEAFYWDASAASLGIGTNSPSKLSFLETQLSVESTQDAGIHIVGNRSGADAAVGYLTFINNGSTVTSFNKRIAGLTAARDGDDEAGNLQFLTSNSAGTLSERMRIDSSGNVGIGTNSIFNPGGSVQKVLELSGSGYSTLFVSANSAAVRGQFGADNVNGFVEIGSRTNHSFRILTNNSEKMRIDASGNVGIGVSPSAWGSGFVGLDLGGSTAANIGGISRTRIASNIYYDGSNFRLKESYGGAYYFQDAASNTHTWGTAATGTGGAVATLTERMRINSGGYLKASNDGVYRSSTGNWHELIQSDSEVIAFLEQKNENPFGPRIEFNTDINNTSNYFLRCTGNGTSRALIYSNGNIVNTNNSYGAISDAKLKENVVDASPKLEDLMQVQVRNFNYIGDDKKQLGVVAQELEEVFPSMIDESPDFEEVEVPQLDENGQEVLDENGEVVMTKERVDLGTVTKSVKYSVFVPMLIKAIQELKAEVDTLKSQLNA